MGVGYGGQGVDDLGKVKIKFSEQRGVSATRCFLPDQKILSLDESFGYCNLENTGNYPTCANFKCDFSKMDIFGI